METLITLSLVVGGLLPMLISAINSTGWSTAQQSLVGFVVCLGAAALTLWAQGSFTSGQDIVAALSAVYGAAMATYHGFYGPSGIGDAIERTIRPGGLLPLPGPKPPNSP